MDQLMNNWSGLGALRNFLVHIAEGSAEPCGRQKPLSKRMD